MAFIDHNVPTIDPPTSDCVIWLMKWWLYTIYKKHSSYLLSASGQNLRRNIDPLSSLYYEIWMMFGWEKAVDISYFGKYFEDIINNLVHQFSAIKEP